MLLVVVPLLVGGEGGGNDVCLREFRAFFSGPADDVVAGVVFAVGDGAHADGLRCSCGGITDCSTDSCGEIFEPDGAVFLSLAEHAFRGIRGADGARQ